jgi:alkanesulfonate monooxygenase SsuD/methylene tetrahydromethanopterin reductase-like flavin-dependent oxidoreductase (luciferase family)
VQFGLRFDMRAPHFGAPAGDLYQAALEMCEWSDAHGFGQVRFMEHHGSDDGFCPSPLIMAGAAAARTHRIVSRVSALIVPLHDPVRLAEDIAVVDQIARGRLQIVLGAGYVPSEFAMFGRLLSERAALMEDGIRCLLDAWTGESFTYRGRRAVVPLRPHRRPRPPLFLGGSSAAAARRAARLCDGFEPTSPELFDVYLAECAALGIEPGPRPRPKIAGRFLHVTEQPDRLWQQLGPHLLHECQSYENWLAEAGSSGGVTRTLNVADLRASGAYHIVTPEECLALARRLGPTGQLEFHPLVAGADPEIGWSSLRLFQEQVMPALSSTGVMTSS